MAKARVIKSGRKYVVQEFVGIGWATLGTFYDGKCGDRAFGSKREAAAWCARNGYTIGKE